MPTVTMEPSPTFTATAEPSPTFTATVEPSPTLTATAEPSPTPTATSEPNGGFPAFPGAEGAGACARGGRGGRVLKVTRLDDTGSDTKVGTLRWALRQSGPRIVVFDIGGTIELIEPIYVVSPYLTIAGQTAPGGGITVKNYQLVIVTHDVVVRYIRFRPGDEQGLDEIHGLSIGNYPRSFTDYDRMGHDIIIDHCSLSWAADDTLNIWNMKPEINRIEKITVQWSIVSEALNRLSKPGGSPQGLAMVMGPGDSVTNISIHHNLFAHNLTRNPRISGGRHEVINNIFYNNTLDTKLTTDKAKTFLNYVGNYAIDGPSTYAYRHMLCVAPDDTIGPPYTTYRYEPEIFVQGNMGRFRTLPTDDEWSIVGQGLYGPSDPANPSWQRSTAHSMPGIPVTIQSYQEAYIDVLAKAGASLVRDAVDERVSNEVRDRTGRQIGSQDEVGGWPNLAAGNPPTDTDHDGMPDDWETQRGLDPSQDDSAGDRDGDGYTNIEEYINGF